MPSTLVHLGTQGMFTRALWRPAPLLWVYLGAVLPDLPWILQRAIKAAVPSVDLASLRLYAVSQASLLGCLVLAAAIGAIATRWRVVFALLGGGALLHLLLDAVEIKWANGVLPFAPLDWRPWQLGWFWSDSWAAIAWTALALAWVAWHGREAWDESPRVAPSRRRRAIGAVLLLVWLLLPLTMMAGARRGDVHFVRTLEEVAERPGRPVELYKAHAWERPGRDVVETLEREELTIEGLELEGHQRVSIRGRFVDETTIRVDEAHVHAPGWRDLGSYVGLAFVALVWGRWAWSRTRRRSELST